MNRIRLTVVETHAVQYNAPWYRYIAQHCGEIDLTVVYASRPTPSQQAAASRISGHRSQTGIPTPHPPGRGSSPFHRLSTKTVA